MTDSATCGCQCHVEGCPERPDTLREAVAALHMAGIKTGAHYEQLTAQVIEKVYSRRVDVVAAGDTTDTP